MVTLKRNDTYLILHRELALALCATTKSIRVSEHIVESNLCDSSELVFADLAVHNRAAALVESTNHSALELSRCNDFDGHDRLENRRPSLGECLAERTDSSQLESQFRRIDCVRKTILQYEANATDRVARERALGASFVETL